jgi:sugar phosphate isomerase/epimerase
LEFANPKSEIQNQQSIAMPPPISVQLYSVREAAAKDFPSVLKKIADIGYVGVETAGLNGLKPKEFRKIIDGLGMEISSGHAGIPEGDQANAILDEQEEMGNTTLISGFGPNDLADEAGVKRAVARVNAAVPLLKTRKMRMGLHNHWWEFSVKINGKTVHQLMMELLDPSVFAETDIYWIQTGGGDPAAVIRQLGKRAPYIHVKDGACVRDPVVMTAVGKGKVDVKAALTANAAEWHVVELDACATDMFEAVKDSYTFLTQSGLSKGRK